MGGETALDYFEDMPEWQEFYEDYNNLLLYNSTPNITQYDDIFERYSRINDSAFKITIDYMDIILVPIVVLIGLGGNMLSFLVFVCTYMRRQSSCIYLAALSVADTLFLLCVAFSWAKHTGVYVYDKNGWCQTFMYITYVSSFLSVWYVVAFTCERYIVIMMPLKRTQLCTTKRAKIVVCVLGISASLLYSFGTWTSGVIEIPGAPGGRRVCVPLPQYTTVVDIFYNIDTVMTLILPFIAIVVMNLKITHKVVQFYRIKKKCPTQQESRTERQIKLAIAYSYVRQSSVTSRTRVMYTKTQVRVTKMLLSVSTIFLVLNLPRHTTRTYSFIMRLLNDNYIPSPYYVLCDKLFQYLYYMHFSVNLFLYSVLNNNFRKALVWLSSKIRHSCRESCAKYTPVCTLHESTNSNRDVKSYASYRYRIENQYV